MGIIVIWQHSWFPEKKSSLVWMAINLCLICWWNTGIACSCQINFIDFVLPNLKYQRNCFKCISLVARLICCSVLLLDSPCSVSIFGYLLRRTLLLGWCTSLCFYRVCWWNTGIAWLSHKFRWFCLAKRQILKKLFQTYNFTSCKSDLLLSANIGFPFSVLVFEALF